MQNILTGPRTFLAILISSACSLADTIDIVTDAVPDAYYKREEDPSLYVSATTGRGPLNRTWRTEYRDACYRKCGTGAQSSSSPSSSPSPTHSQHSSPSPARTPKGSSDPNPEPGEREQTAAPTPGASAASSDSGLESNNASIESSIGIGAVAAGAVAQSGSGSGTDKKYKQKAFMCAYKVVRINLSIWGLQTRGEAWTESGTHSCDSLALIAVLVRNREANNVGASSA